MCMHISELKLHNGLNPEHKMAVILQKTVLIHIFERKLLYFYSDFPQIYSLCPCDCMSALVQVIAWCQPNSWQAITAANADPVHSCICHQGPLLQQVLIFNPTWIRNHHMPNKVCDEITYAFVKELRNWYVCLFHSFGKENETKRISDIC